MSNFLLRSVEARAWVIDSNMAGNESYVYALIWSDELSNPIDMTLGLKGFSIDLSGVETDELGLDGRKGDGSSGL